MYDLQAELHVDFIDFFEGRRPWWQLYSFLDRLPSWRHYKSELAEDDEWAEMVLDQQEADEEVAPAADPDRIGPLHYTPEISYLALIADRVLGVRSAIFAAQSEDQEPSIPTLPRPETALDRARERRVIKTLLEIERELFGGGLEVQT